MNILGQQPDEPLANWRIYLDLNNDGLWQSGQKVTVLEASNLDLSVPPSAASPTATSTMNVSGLTGPIEDVDVQLNIQHSLNFDVRVTLVSPQGTRVELFSQTGADSDNFTDTVLDDEATVSLRDGVAPYNSRFQPLSPLRQLDGEDPNGTWTLEVTDDFPMFESGRLNSWGLTITTPDGTTPEPITWSNEDGYYSIADLAPGQYIVREIIKDGAQQVEPENGAGHQVTLSQYEYVTGLDFANRVPPDLRVSGLRVRGFAGSFVKFGQQLPIEYSVDLANSGKPRSADFWFERIWLTDDGVVDGQGYELLLDSSLYDAVGTRQTTVTLPHLANERSTNLGGAVDAQLVQAGVYWVIQLDALGELAEVDERNNIQTAKVDWLLPELRMVELTEQPKLEYNARDHRFRAIGQLRYKVQNSGLSDIPAGVTWIEQIWLGTDENVLVNDPDRGIYHVAVDQALSDTFRAAGDLGALAGQDPNGDWLLEIVDDAAGDTGVLTAWSLTVRAEEPSALSTADNPDTAEEDESGRYQLATPPGSIPIRIVVPPDFVQTWPTAGAGHEVDVVRGQTAGPIDFGIRRAFIIQTLDDVDFIQERVKSGDAQFDANRDGSVDCRDFWFC